MRFIDIEKIIHPYFGTSLSQWIRLLWVNKGVDFNRLPLAIAITVVVALLTPFRLMSSIGLKSITRKIEVRSSPVIIMGHWRSGTTFLHNLMSSAGRFGYINTAESFFPHFLLFIRGEKSLIGWLGKKITIKRLQDNVSVNVMHSPAEEETALGNKSLLSFYHGLIFRKQYSRFFKRTMLMDDATDEAEWKKNYDVIMRQVTAVTQKRLLIKNPFNMTKVKMLHEMYPDAKFIYIFRNPYDVYASMKNLHNKMACKALQGVDELEMQNHILSSYAEIMERFNKDVSLIPSKNVVRIRYEDLERNPLTELERIYNSIGLDSYDKDKISIEHYLNSIKTYKKNTYSLKKNEIDDIVCSWGKYIKQMGYQLPATLLTEQ